MSKKIVIALGGNALGSTLHEQADAVQITAKAIVDLIAAVAAILNTIRVTNESLINTLKYKIGK